MAEQRRFEVGMRVKCIDDSPAFMSRLVPPKHGVINAVFPNIDGIRLEGHQMIWAWRRFEPADTSPTADTVKWHITEVYIPSAPCGCRAGCLGYACGFNPMPVVEQPKAERPFQPGDTITWNGRAARVVSLDVGGTFTLQFADERFTRCGYQLNGNPHSIVNLVPSGQPGPSKQEQPKADPYETHRQELVQKLIRNGFRPHPDKKHGAALDRYVTMSMDKEDCAPNKWKGETMSPRERLHAHLAAEHTRQADSSGLLHPKEFWSGRRGGRRNG